eukprot:TRINITY_DN7273_c0_g1_i1.p1 TRINITY_DN7273_c0_g1~~TRINITY_DN7273_c0_g1_i1.p1  ORF type:complete len:253 (+),score=31.82 TRINITY_DN7273_c0_g1_i1:396-1154(+)
MNSYSCLRSPEFQKAIGASPNFVKAMISLAAVKKQQYEHRRAIKLHRVRKDFLDSQYFWKETPFLIYNHPMHFRFDTRDDDDVISEAETKKQFFQVRTKYLWDNMIYDFALTTRLEEKNLMLIKEEETIETKKYIISRTLHNTRGGFTTYKVLSVVRSRANFWESVTYDVVMNDKTIEPIRITGSWPSITVERYMGTHYEPLLISNHDWLDTLKVIVEEDCDVALSLAVLVLVKNLQKRGIDRANGFDVLHI